MKSIRALKTALGKIRAVFLEGTAVRLVDEKWASPEDVVSGMGAFRKGGRYNAAGSFRAVYLTEDARVGLTEVGFPISMGGRFRLESAGRVTVVPVRFRLKKVLDLCDYRVRIALGTDLEEIVQPIEPYEARGEGAPTQVLGRVAWRLGFSAIRYPSRHNIAVCNLVVFPDNLGPPEEYLKPAPLEGKIP